MERIEAVADILMRAQSIGTAIQSLSVRGAPLIGIAAAMTVAREALLQKSSEQILHAIQSLRTSRPTAVNENES